MTEPETHAAAVGQRDSQRRPAWPRIASVVLCSLVCAVGVGELGLRLVGQGPLRFVGNPDYKPYYQAHPALGWSHVPGRFEVAGAGTTYLEDSSRATSKEDLPPGTPIVLVVGGSFTEGYGVEDEETFAWLLREALGDRRVINLGTGGYGTLQALLTLEQFLGEEHEAALGARVEHVIYGTIAHHKVRNVGAANWRRVLAAQSRGSAAEPVRIPHALIGEDGELQRFAPEPWPWLGLCRRLAIANLITESWVRTVTRERSTHELPVTLALIDEMQRLANASGAGFTVAYLGSGKQGDRFKGQLAGGLQELDIPFLDCSHPKQHTPPFMSPETQHPTPRLQAYYARHLAQHMRKLRSSTDSKSPISGGD